MERPALILLYALTITLGVVAYWPSLSVPFYLDDFSSIVDNPLLTTDWGLLNQHYFGRQLTYYSFALTYEVFGEEPLVYHLTNMVLHLAVAASVALLSKRLVTIVGGGRAYQHYCIFLTFALFLLAPLNTQAVTYIVQRAALLSALFYVLALWAYLGARTYGGKQRLIYTIAVLVFISMGAISKQNIVTLPVAFLLLELFLFKTVSRLWQWVLYSVLAVGLAGLFAIDLIPNLSEHSLLHVIDQATRLQTEMPRYEYFAHQLVILWQYIYKFFVPYPLLLEYPTTVYSATSSQVLLSGVGHLAVIVVAISLRQRLPLITVCVGLFYLAHSVESALIPIVDLAFEHRTYLPNAFLAVLVGSCLAGLLSRYRLRTVVFVAIALTLVFTFLTYKRNELWGKPISFYRHELTHVGDNWRSYAALGLFEAKRGRFKHGVKWLRVAIKVGSERGQLQAKPVIAYMDLLHKTGNTPRAKYIGVLAAKSFTRNQDKSMVWSKLAQYQVEHGNCDFAKGLIERSLQLDSSNIIAQRLARACSP
ncbi:hypothetical protein HMF8227_00720 [Saliniradius amylolyticus]|uniref:Transmembrane and TPR repeat-containing protein n=1 Tax=Saliniradius amylolyticus TaxID=2183582 RepID=A0A2S2E0R3_9ALTE|nr:hypothetical protein [Saliniradius amylolyticus]AWL11216.1 hypothetical protein HMF8227_00720 [Saliniradius amylolyticus]